MHACIGAPILLVRIPLAVHFCLGKLELLYGVPCRLLPVPGTQYAVGERK